MRPLARGAVQGLTEAAGERVILTDPACDFGFDEVYGGVILEP